MAAGAEIALATLAGQKLADWLLSWATGKAADRGLALLGERLGDRAYWKAFRSGLAEACADLAKDDPDFTASFFDETFFKTAGRSELEKLLSAEERPDAAALAETFRTKALPHAAVPELERRCTLFLDRLEAVLRTRPALWPIFDRRDQRASTRAVERLQSVPEDAPRFKGAISKFLEIYLGTDDAQEPSEAETPNS